MKVSVIGAGSICFGIELIKDLALNEKICDAGLEISLMDIDDSNLAQVNEFALNVFKKLNREAKITHTTDLIESVTGADFVVTAIEVDRYKYWHMDFHIPKQYGSSQAYGENGGPGSMFHFMRNIGPMLDIAHAIEQYAPNAWLINYTNPEAKLIEAISKLTSVKCVGLCHGLYWGVVQIADLIDKDMDEIEFKGGGLNHFGWFTSLTDKNTGEDLYPLLRKRNREIDPIYSFDHIALSRKMLDLYGLYPYPGNNHVGEYVKYGKEFYAAHVAQFYYDPIRQTPSKFIYTADKVSLNPEKYPAAEEVNHYNLDNIEKSIELGVPIIESIYFDIETQLPSVNMLNNGAFKDLDDDMVIETQAVSNKDGIKFIHEGLVLPTAIKSYTRLQGDIHKLLIEAYVEKSKDKLLQAILLDPQCPSFNQAVAMIDDLYERQRDLMPELYWKEINNDY